MAAKAQTNKTKASRTKTRKQGASDGRKALATKGPGCGRTARKNLVIVESPAKARTLGRILGSKYLVTASQGHVRDLPKSKVGVDLENDFQPTYVVMRDKRSILNGLKKASDDAKDIYLATDPDREGEAISWHLQTAAQWDRRPELPKRVVFHEITQEAVSEAFQHPRELDMKLVNAQQARRILDRLVGYQISPLLKRRVQGALSAGRVQSVALRMVVDREREIQAFVPTEWWTLEAQLRKDLAPRNKQQVFTALLYSRKGDRGRITISGQTEVNDLQTELEGANYLVAEVQKRDVKQRPTAPFTTSTLQQEAGRKLRFTARRTMMVAQQLYEGLPLGKEGSVGLITYMRTDSTNVAMSAVRETREYIGDRFGKQYLPDQPRLFRTKAKGAQEAHEAIRPTSVRRTPDSVKTYLTSEQSRLYRLIWMRMVASQMADAISEATTADIEATARTSRTVFIFRATGSVLKVQGFRALYLEGRDDGEAEESRDALPELAVHDPLACLKLDALQHFTEPPPRYTEGTLIKAMEERGIGRPSTYAPTVSTIMDRHYVVKEQNRLVPTDLGMIVTDMLTEFFTDVMDLDFTAKMEEELDEVSRGDREWVPVLHQFYAPFQKALEKADEAMPKVKTEELTDQACNICGRPMVIKVGRFGRFIACTGFPECRNTKPILKKTGAMCPQCGGDIVQRHARGKRRIFYGCSQYPTCNFVSQRLPLAGPCPECGGLMVRDRDKEVCTVCAWKGPIESKGKELAAVGD